MSKWSPNGHQNSTKMLPKISLKMRPVPKGPWRCVFPYLGALAPIKMREFCGRGVKNLMFAHVTAFSRKVPIFSQNLTCDKHAQARNANMHKHATQTRNTNMRKHARAQHAQTCTNKHKHAQTCNTHAQTCTTASIVSELNMQH